MTTRRNVQWRCWARSRTTRHLPRWDSLARGVLNSDTVRKMFSLTAASAAAGLWEDLPLSPLLARQDVKEW